MVKKKIVIDFEIDIPDEVLQQKNQHDWVFEQLGSDLTSYMDADNIAVLEPDVKSEQLPQWKSETKTTDVSTDKAKNRIRIADSTVQTKVFDIYNPVRDMTTDRAFFVYSSDDSRHLGILVQQESMSAVVMVATEEFIDQMEDFIHAVITKRKKP